MRHCVLRHLRGGATVDSEGVQLAVGAAVIHPGLPGVVSHRADHKSVAATAVINRADLVAGAAGIDRIAAISDEVIVVPKHDQYASISGAANICPPRFCPVELGRTS